MSFLFLSWELPTGIMTLIKGVKIGFLRKKDFVFKRDFLFYFLGRVNGIQDLRKKIGIIKRLTTAKIYFLDTAIKISLKGRYNWSMTWVHKSLIGKHEGFLFSQSLEKIISHKIKSSYLNLFKKDEKMIGQVLINTWWFPVQSVIIEMLQTNFLLET